MVKNQGKTECTSACSTSPRTDADLGKSALMHIARLMNSPAKGLKRMVRQIIGGAPLGAYVPRDSLQSTLHEGKCWDPHIPGDAYVGRGHRLPPGRRQHEDGGPLDPAVQGVGDFRIRRFMVAGAAPGVDSRGGSRADVAGRAGSHCKARVAACTPGRRRGYQEKIGGRQRHEIWVKHGCPCRESECPKGQTSKFSGQTAGCHSTAHSTGAGRRGGDEKSWRCKPDSKSEEEAGCGLEDEAKRKGRRGRQSSSASGFGGLGTRETKGGTPARAWKRGTLPRLVKVQGVWEAGAEQQLRTWADGAWSMSALIASAAPRLSPAALVIEFFEGDEHARQPVGSHNTEAFTGCF